MVGPDLGLVALIYDDLALWETAGKTQTTPPANIGLHRTSEWLHFVIVEGL